MLIALLTFLFFGPSPIVSAPQSAPRDCSGLTEIEWRLCQPREVRLGEFDARPAPYDWSYNNFPSAPSDWGTYATEKRD